MWGRILREVKMSFLEMVLAVFIGTLPLLWYVYTIAHTLVAGFNALPEALAEVLGERGQEEEEWSEADQEDSEELSS